MECMTGSLQRKRGWFYYVFRRNGHQQWIALRTRIRRIARQRAFQFVGCPGGNEAGEAQWLLFLVQCGDRARTQLSRLHKRQTLAWNGLWNAYLLAHVGTISTSGRVSYERWLRILTDWARKNRIVAPAFLDPVQARKCANDLSADYASVNRMLYLFRNVWKTLDMDGGVWACGTVRSSVVHEHYRRLSVPEVRRIEAYFRERDATLADVIALGYYTGLRLSDVCELERGEVAESHEFLNLQPNKTRGRKEQILRIPLVPDAKRIVSDRMATYAKSAVELFPELRNVRPSRLLSRGFAACGVKKDGNGRASFHSLRATFISMMDEAGVPPHVTDAITGHCGGGMHARYTQPSASALMAAVKRALVPLLPQ